MFRYLAIAAVALGAPQFVSEARAQATVECHSRNYQYDECFAGPLRQPQLVHQISGSSCILNRTWGFNPRNGYIWVAQGCAGVFADVAGYHHGRGDTFDQNARMYDHHGHDAGAAVAGAVLGALVEGMAERGSRNHRHVTSNYRDDGGYNGCHGVGCLVDNPDDNRGGPPEPGQTTFQSSDQEIDTRPQFDRDGNPNFDTEGNYQGCHGVGCLVDNPDDAN